ncbi:Phosphotransferase enzyme family [Trueperella bialowiezensis]|uniref:Phosphotransferase enzyme family n=1 Tax=Trueperella bialowiezensis TaxID=312285 RepID=A0A3S4Z4P5_9ACTO|nr:Phosphotransferase enzyme family [Trueperella bialowiezensis]
MGYSVVWDEFTGTNRNERIRGDLYVVASTARIAPDLLKLAGAQTLYADNLPVHVWQFPHDPELPALELACDPEKLGKHVNDDVEVELLSYRPTRRAVVRASTSDHDIYAKVIRPVDVAQHVQRLHICEAAQLPTPRLVGSTPEGLILTSAVTGRALSAAYVRGENLDATFESLSTTLDSLPLIGRGLKRRPAWSERADQYARSIAASAPELASRARQAAADITQLRADADLGPLTATHGDFYEANILVSPATGQVTGLLDLDSFGPGYRADDWGCLLGHLSVLPSLNPKYAGLGALAQTWFARARREVDPVALAASSAGVVLSLVASARQRASTNWKKQALARMDVVDSWLARAGVRCA